MDELEYRDVRLVDMKAGGEPGTFSGYGAVFGNVDAYGDVIKAGAFAETLQDWQTRRGKWPPMLLQHGGGGLFGGGAADMLPVGQWTEMEENRRGLRVTGKLFALETEKGQYIYEGLRSGALDGLSVGFKTKEHIDGTQPDEPRRTLTAVDLWEVSIVTFPANDRARIGSVKSFTPEQLRDLEGILRDSGLSRAHSLRAVSAFKKYLQSETGAGAVAVPANAGTDADVMGSVDALLSQVLAATFRQ